MFIFKSLKSKIRSFFRDEELKKKMDELLYSQIFHDTIKGSKWLDTSNFDISPGRWAIGYNYLYTVYRILNETKPTSILEFGLGQSTKLINKYVCYYFESDIVHDVIEHDKEWISIFKRNYELNEATCIYTVPLEDHIEKHGYGNSHFCYRTKDLKNIIKQYDFISIDGPWGSEGKNASSRIDILQFLPNCLKNSFTIVVDDYNRSGEQRMVDKILNILEREKIKYRKAVYRGETDICIICSADLSFVCTM